MSPHSSTTDETITVLVGPEDKAFTIRKTTLTQTSDFFKRALRGNWQESRTSIVSLPYANPDAFQVYEAWLSTGNIVLPRTGSSETNRHGDAMKKDFKKVQNPQTKYLGTSKHRRNQSAQFEGSEQELWKLELLSEALVLGDTELSDNAFQRSVVVVLVDKSNAVGQVPPANVVSFVYEGTSLNSLARKVMVLLYKGIRWPDSAWKTWFEYNRTSGEFPMEFLDDVGSVSAGEFGRPGWKDIRKREREREKEEKRKNTKSMKGGLAAFRKMPDPVGFSDAPEEFIDGMC